MDDAKGPLLAVCLFFLFGSTVLGSCTADTSDDPVAQENADNNIVTLNTEQNMDVVYTTDYQTEIDLTLQDYKDNNIYTLEDPLMVANPYGTNTTGLYVYFTTETPVKISYTVSADGYSDFSRELYGEYSTEHESLLIGMIPDTLNTITLTAVDEEGNTVGTREIEYQTSPLLGSAENVQLEVTKGESSAELSDGLYTMLGNRTGEDNEQTDYILLYDNNGTLRSEIPIKSYRACNILFDNSCMYYSTSADEIAVMDSTGQLLTVYSMGDYQLHHDYIFGSENDLLVLASQEDAETEEDRILSVDLDSGTVTELIDLADLFGDYLDSLTADETAATSTDSAGADSNGSDSAQTEDEPLDWMHINSIRLIGEDSIIISSRETSTIIKIDDIYGEPVVDYMIGSGQFWEESGYDSLLLEQAGDFSLQAGQHCVEYETSGELEDGQYYLYFYNNNNAVCDTRGYDYSSDDSYSGTYSGTEGGESYYYKYLVDENERTFELIEQIPVTYSGYVSSVQQTGNNLLIDSGSAFTAVELDENNTPVQTLAGTGDTWWYRVFKYDYSGFWFE